MTHFVDIDGVLPIVGNPPKSWIYRRTAAGHSDPIPHYRPGNRLLFDPDEVTAWVESHRVTRDDLEWAPPWIATPNEEGPADLAGPSSTPRLPRQKENSHESKRAHA